MLEKLMTSAATRRFSKALLITAGITIGAVSSATAADFKWSFGGDAQTLDPYGLSEIYTLGFQSNFYEPLIRRSANLDIEPALAASWKIVDETHWIFNLRKGVTFHNGDRKSVV